MRDVRSTIHLSAFRLFYRTGQLISKRQSLGESNAVFLRGVGGDAATEPHKTGCCASIFKPGETIRRGSTRRRRRSVDCQNWASSSCRLWRAGATGGGRDGRPRESRILRATTGSSIAARIRIRERQRSKGGCVPLIGREPQAAS